MAKNWRIILLTQNLPEIFCIYYGSLINQNLYYHSLNDYTRIYISKHSINHHNRYISVNYFGHILQSKNWNKYATLIMQHHWYILYNYKYTMHDLKILKKIPRFSEFSNLHGRNSKAIRYIFKYIYKGQIGKILTWSSQEIFIAASCKYLDENELLNKIINLYIKSQHIQKFIWIP